MKTPTYPSVKKLATDEGAIVRWKGFSLKLQLVWLEGEDENLALARKLVAQIRGSAPFPGFGTGHTDEEIDDQLAKRFKAVLDAELEPPMKSPALRVLVRFKGDIWIHLGSTEGPLDLAPLGDSRLVVMGWLNELCTDRLDDVAEAWLERCEECEED